MIDLTTTNLFLGILAGVAVVELLALITAGVMMRRAWQRGVERVDAFERRLDVFEQRAEQMMAPLAARAGAIMDHVERVSARVDHGAEKLDRALAVTGRGAEIALTAVNGNLQRTATLAAALASGGRAALRAWRSNGSARAPRPTSVGRVPAHTPTTRDTEEPYVSI